MSLGTIIALQMAISYPEKVASLFLISPLGLEEVTLQLYIDPSTAYLKLARF